MLNKKVIKICCGVVTAGLLLSGTYAIARVIVDLSYDSMSVVGSREDEHAPDKKADMREFGDIDDGEWGSAVVLYDGTNIEERQKKYLGDDYDKYIDVINKIEEDSDKEFENLPSEPTEDTSNAYNCILGADDLSGSMLEEYGTVRTSSSLGVVGLYDSNRVVYVYGYPDEVSDSPVFVCADYSSEELNKSAVGLFDFGQSHSFVFKEGMYSVESVDGYEVIYARG